MAPANNYKRSVPHDYSFKKFQLTAAFGAGELFYFLFRIWVHFLTAARTHMPRFINRRSASFLAGIVWVVLLVRNEVILFGSHPPAAAVAGIDDFFAIHIALGVLQHSLHQPLAKQPFLCGCFCAFAYLRIPHSHAEENIIALSATFAHVAMSITHLGSFHSAKSFGIRYILLMFFE